jgi:integrase
MFTGRRGPERSMTTRQYARLVSEWIASIGLDPHIFGTHSLRRTKATFIYRRTGNLRAVQLLLGHTKIESTVRYLGIEVDTPSQLPNKPNGESGRWEFATARYPRGRPGSPMLSA